MKSLPGWIPIDRKKSVIVLMGLFTMASACSGIPENSESLEADMPTAPIDEASIPEGKTDATATESTTREFEIVTLLPKDAIPAIDDPIFYSVEEADREYASNEQVLGVEFGGEARAYSTGLLSSHEIVNDTVGGRKIAVTW